MFLAIGCASEQLYRYINYYHKDIDYCGIGISEHAIERAKSKYPKWRFAVSEEIKVYREP